MRYLLEREDCTLVCEMEGSGQPLLLIHGIACDREYFKGAAERLKENFTVIRYDRRGYSDSKAKENADYSLVAQAQDGLAVLEKAGFQDAFIAGSSAGSLVGLEMAYSAPKTVRALFLHEPPLAMTVKDQEVIDFWREKLMKDSDEGKLNRAMLHFYQIIGGSDPKAEPRSLEETAKAMENMKVSLKFELEEILTYYRVLEKREKLSMPICLAAGKEDTEGIFSVAAKENAKVLGVKFLSVGGYHNFPLERPGEFAKALQDFFLK